jgi:hypothetical protein
MGVLANLSELKGSSTKEFIFITQHIKSTSSGGTGRGNCSQFRECQPVFDKLETLETD